MPSKPLKVLLVEDSEDDATLTLETLRKGGFEPRSRRVDSMAEMRAALAERDWDVALSDYNLPLLTGHDALALRHASVPELPFIVVSGCIGEEAAVGLMRAGADDCIMKDNLGRLVPAVERCLKEAHNRRQRQLAQLALRESEARYRAIVTNIPGMVFQLLRLPDGSFLFPYASEGCLTLLGVRAAGLMHDSAHLVERIAPEDRGSFLDSMALSANRLGAWNWEGRIALAHGEHKWLNLRSTPRRLAGGEVQWEGIILNVSHAKFAEFELRRSRERLRELSAHIQSVKERERTRIAREIHDDLGGTLTAIKIELLRLAKHLPLNLDHLHERASSIEALADSALETTHRISTELRPGILDLGIVAAVEWQAKEFGKHFGVACAVERSGEEIELDPDAAFAVFRIFQEALTNVAKHSDASHVAVRLGFDCDRFELSVHDDGRGLTEGDLSKPRSFGVHSIVERARDLGGEASVTGIPGRGTTVVVRIPTAGASSEIPAPLGAAKHGSPDLSGSEARR
ncbi:MAG: histidine kinase [Betaproteobacteria bacterium]|nr:histidine kinase [Betaproteobacteria bacterium]